MGLADVVAVSRMETGDFTAKLGAAVVKRRNRGPADAYVLMTLEQFAAMIGDAADPRPQGAVTGSGSV